MRLGFTALRGSIPDPPQPEQRLYPKVHNGQAAAFCFPGTLRGPCVAMPDIRPDFLLNAHPC